MRRVSEEENLPIALTMNGFNGRGVLDRMPNGGTSLHSQVDFISNSLEWITKEMVRGAP